jgi:type II secretory pathway pseudopilin PulG
MTAKKTVAAVAAVLAVLGLLVVVVVGGVLLFVSYQVRNSDAAVIARSFLKNNDRLKRDIGEVKDFGSLVTGNINVQNGNGTATLNLKVMGGRKTVNAAVELTYRSGKEWRVTGASYKDDTGRTVDLLNPDQSRQTTLHVVMFLSSSATNLSDSGLQTLDFRL